MSAMDIDLPLEDVIKKSNIQKKAKKKNPVKKGEPQSKHAVPIAKQSTQRGGKIGKSFTSGTAKARGVAKNGSAPQQRASFSSAAAKKRGGISTVCTFGLLPRFTFDPPAPLIQSFNKKLFPLSI